MNAKLVKFVVLKQNDMKRILIIMAALTFAVASCGPRGGKGASEAEQADSTATAQAMEQKQIEEPMFDIFTNKGKMRIKLYNKTPKHRDNFVKLVYSAQMFRRGGQGGGSIQLSSEENGYAKATVNTTPEGIGNNVVWLRLQKKGDVYTAFYSADGKKFVEAGKLETGLKDIKAGVIACDGVMPSFGGFRRGAMPMADPKPMTASFDYFRIISK